MLYKRIYINIFLLVAFTFLGFNSFAEPTVAEGKTLFKANCASCHAKNMKSKLTGPALGGVEDRWADYPKQDLYDWVRSSQKMIASGHPYANELWNEWTPTVMTNFPNLTDDQIDGILLYIDDVIKNPVGPPKLPPGEEAVAEGGSSSTAFYIGLLAILGLLAFILMRIVSSLNSMAEEKEGTATGRPATMVEQLLSPKVIAFALFALILIGGYTTVNNAIDLGRQQGYAPSQPIKFSHATHAGVQKIDCQYCHDGARRSKHSVIPATNTCMNCHTAVKVGSKYGTGELTKIYASASWNPNTGTYFDKKASKEEKEVAFKEWITEQYKEDKGEKFTEKGLNKELEAQWAAIKGHVGKPIEWTKIHNLPDHVYFNHAQHVAVGEVECQTCHGPVEEMEVVQQHAPLSMGWCINCHRQTNVKFADNPYYESYEAYHDELDNPKSGRTGVTVEDIGGLECQKCHY
jgi:cytochrome c2